MKYIISILLLSLSINAWAEERKMILEGEMEFGGWGGPIMRFAKINGKNKILMGGGGALLINHTVYIGGGGWGTIKDIGDGYASYSYGGIFMGSFIKPSKAIHYYADLGIFGANISSGEKGTNNDPKKTEDFYIIEPGAGVAINLLAPIKLMLGVSYKFAGAVDQHDLSSKDLGGAGLYVSVAFGKF